MGDVHRIMRVKDKKFSDPEFEFILHCDVSKLSRNLSSFFTRPAYAHTKAEVGGIR